MTPIPKRDALVSLQGLSPRDYGRWLFVGMGRYLTDGDDVRAAFCGAENYVGWYDAIEQDLAIIFNALHREEQAAFRAGVHIALGEAVTNPQRLVTIAVPLMRLAALISAFDVVDILPALVVSSQSLPDEDRSMISAVALDLAIELAVPTVPASVALAKVLALVTAPGFSDHVAGPALIALTRADPSALPGHLNLLEKPLNAQYGTDWAGTHDEWVEEERNELLAALVSLAPTQALLRAIQPKERSAATTSDWDLYDWFCRGLMESSHPAVQAAAKEVLRLERAYAQSPLEMPSESHHVEFGVSLMRTWSATRNEFLIATGDLGRVVSLTMGPRDPHENQEWAVEAEFADDY